MIYFFKKEINMLNGITSNVRKYHTISQIRVDFINNEMEVQIASFETESDFINMSNGQITGLLIGGAALSQDGAIVFEAMKILSLNQDSIFNGDEILSLETEDKKSDMDVEQN
ncbi:hypothetical protein [Aggregatibacter actinomycetemcomitans]|uniref:hypothetical protein n=1 Tax=Aggregatibacter actinomycetemcomitans TaxID=714 RepID=UPI002151A401|nr:hypothetical protein [Aggregatibacter actinomycetemcomitans]